MSTHDPADHPHREFPYYMGGPFVGQEVSEVAKRDDITWDLTLNGGDISIVKYKVRDGEWSQYDLTSFMFEFEGGRVLEVVAYLHESLGELEITALTLSIFRWLASRHRRQAASEKQQNINNAHNN